MILVVEGQYFACPRFNLPLMFICNTHGIPCSHTKSQDVDTIISGCVQLGQESGSWPSMSTRTIDGNYFKKLAV